MFRPTMKGKRIEIHFGGIPSRSFSSRGLHMCLLHETCFTVTILLRMLVEDPVECGLYECTVRFPIDIFYENEDIMRLNDVFLCGSALKTSGCLTAGAE